MIRFLIWLGIMQEDPGYIRARLEIQRQADICWLLKLLDEEQRKVPEAFAAGAAYLVAAVCERLKREAA